MPDGTRMRCNIFRDNRGVAAVFRHIPAKIPSVGTLGLPESVLEFCKLSKGLVLVTGPTGSGKSTTLAALVDHINEYQADGLLINSIKSCNSFSAGQLLIMREVEKRTGKPAAFIETDLVDPRYFSAANVKNRLESYFQMIEQKRAGASRGAEA